MMNLEWKGLTGLHPLLKCKNKIDFKGGGREMERVNGWARIRSGYISNCYIFSDTSDLKENSVNQ